MAFNWKLDGVGPVDNRPSTDQLQHFVLFVFKSKKNVDFFFFENHVAEENFKLFFCQYLLFWVKLKNPLLDF